MSLAYLDRDLDKNTNDKTKLFEGVSNTLEGGKKMKEITVNNKNIIVEDIIADKYKDNIKYNKDTNSYLVSTEFGEMSLERLTYKLFGRHVDEDIAIFRVKEDLDDFTQMNLTTSVKASQTGYIGVSGITLKGDKEYFVSYFMNMSVQERVSGYYITPYMAALVREVAMLEAISGAEMNFPYFTAEELKAELERVEVFHNTLREERWLQRSENHRETYAENVKNEMDKIFYVNKKNNGLYAPYVKDTEDGKPRFLGMYETEKEAAIARSAYVIKNKLKNHAYQLFGMTEEELLKEAESIKEVSSYLYKRRSSGKGGTIGIDTSSGYYGVLFRYKNKRYYVGAFKSEKLAICVYNVFVTDNDMKRPLNEIDMTLEEQKEFIASSGFVYSEADGKYVSKDKLVMKQS